MLASDTFQGARRSRDFLAYVVAEAIEGRGDLLNARKVARLALERPVDFDVVTDSSVRVQANRLRSRLERYYATEGSDEAIRIEIPIGTYCPTFKLTPRAAPGSQPDGSTRLPGGPVIAVMRFRPAGPGADDRAMAVGLAESLVHQLGSFPTIRVMGPLAVARELGSVPDATEVGRRTGAGFVLNGSVGTVGEHVRVRILLTEAPTGTVLWSETIDHRTEEFAGFDAEDDIAGRVAAIVADVGGVVMRSSVRATPSTDDPTVWVAISSLFVYFDDLDRSRRDAALDRLLRAAATEPGNALVAALLSFTYAVDVLLQGAAAATSMAEAEAIGGRALAMDSASLHARTALAIVALAKGDTTTARRHVSLILERTPYHPSLTYTAGLVLAGCGDWDQAIAVIRRSNELNPLGPGHRRTLLAVDRLLHGDAAAALAEATLIRMSGSFWGPLLRALALADLGMVEGALEAREELVVLAPDILVRPEQVIGAAPAIADDVAAMLGERLRALARLEAP